MTSRSASRPLRVHIENSRALQPVFIVQPHQLDAALARHADLAPRVRITIGFDGENYEDLIRDADALIGYRFAWQALRRQAPALKWIQVLGAGVDYMAPFDWLPPGIVLTTNSGAH
nr:hypothetical protein [Burkholderiaceae bacterium]